MASDVTVAPTLGHAVLMTQGGVGASPGYDAIDLRRMVQAATGFQEGVFDVTGWKVSENSGGANMTVQAAASVGLAQVKGESVTHQGPYIVAPHSATITLDVAAAHSTNPRVDMVILQVRDNTHDALGANDARVRILSGTATSGATLANLNGQQSLPSNAVRLADVLVPAADTTISNSQIRDRRPWARGAFSLSQRTTGNITTTTSPLAEVDVNILKPRIECSGGPVRLHFFGVMTHSSANQITSFGFHIDGAAIPSTGTLGAVSVPAAANNWTFNVVYVFTPSAGNHQLAPTWGTTAATATMLGTAANPASFTVEELDRVSADNGAV